MTRTVLLVAFHFPPAAMGSGHLRTLGFARYLPDFGWRPLVLSARAMAYPRTLPIQHGTIPSGCIVRRAFAPDISRHLSIGGRYPGFLAQPDRWTLWRPAAIAAGLRLIRRQHVDAIWSTYPIMSAHCIAHALHHRTGLPWIADFRDPVSTSVEPGNQHSVASQHWWEKEVLGQASATVFTTRGTLLGYAARFPEAAKNARLHVIANGFDDAAFTGLPALAPVAAERRGPLHLVHSGMLYADGRNPLPFLTAVARLKARGTLSADSITITLRASGSEPLYARELERLGIVDLVTFAPPIPNQAALCEQAGADGLLLFQGARFNHQIPAKVYEYLRIGKPIFALVHAAGDTAELLRESGGSKLVPIDDVDAIAERLAAFLQALRDGAGPHPRPEVVSQYSRRAGAEALADLLRQVSN